MSSNNFQLPTEVIEEYFNLNSTLLYKNYNMRNN